MVTYFRMKRNGIDMNHIVIIMYSKLEDDREILAMLIEIIMA